MSLMDLIAAFQVPFMSRAAVALAVLAVAGAVVGLFVNLRGLEFVTDGLAHSVFPGLVIGFLVAGQDGVAWGALIAAGLASVLLTFVDRRGVGSDAGIAVVMASMFSLGVVLVSRESGYVAALEQLLFGHLLTVTDSTVVGIVIGCVAAVALVAATWRAQVFRAFDATGSQVAGYHPLAGDLTLNAAVALVVVAGSQAVGNLLALAMIIVPVAIARLITSRLGWLVPIAAVVGVVASLGGLALAFQVSIESGVNASPSSLVVLTLVGVYAVVLVARVVLSLVVRRRSAYRARAHRAEAGFAAGSVAETAASAGLGGGR